VEGTADDVPVNKKKLFGKQGDKATTPFLARSGSHSHKLKGLGFSGTWNITNRSGSYSFVG
jgi:hypothetical protein